MLELIGDLRNVSEICVVCGEVLRIIGMFSLLPGVGEVVLGVLSGHPVMLLERG